MYNTKGDKRAEEGPRRLKKAMKARTNETLIAIVALFQPFVSPL
jgi:hypothetical protein